LTQALGLKQQPSC